MFGGLKKTLFSNPAINRHLLLYGLQRSGTNYLESIVKLNYPTCRFINGELRNDILHKHFRLYDDKQIIPEPQFVNQLRFKSFSDFESSLPTPPDLYLVISKDPHSWFASYGKWSKKNNWPAHAYHYIEEYNLFYGKWMEFYRQTNKILFIRYVDLLQQPLLEINKIGKALNLPAPAVLKTTKKVYASRTFSRAEKDEFLKQAHLKKISAEDFNLINEKLNKELIRFLGYETVNVE